MYRAIFMFLMVGFVSNLNAQAENLRIGTSIDILPVSWMNSDTPGVERAGTNYSFGVDLKLEYHFSPFLALTSGIGMQFNQGGTLSYKNGGNILVDAELSEPELHNLPLGSTINYSIRYFEVPLSLKMRTNEMGRFRVFCELPRFELGITTNAKGAINNGQQVYSKEKLTKSVSWLNPSYGFMVGTEYSLNENISAFAGLYLKQGMFDITENKGFKSKDKTGMVSLVAGVLF